MVGFYVGFYIPHSISFFLRLSTVVAFTEYTQVNWNKDDVKTVEWLKLTSDSEKKAQEKWIEEGKRRNECGTMEIEHSALPDEKTLCRMCQQQQWETEKRRNEIGKIVFECWNYTK